MSMAPGVRRRIRFRWYMAGGAVLLVAFAAVGLYRGSVALDPADVAAVLATRLLPGDYGPVDRQVETIVWSLRAPRVLVAAMVGGCLALAGAQMQGLFRNPLASPGIVGTSTGAATGAVFALTFGLAGAFGLAAPLFAVGGALLSLLIVTRIATRDGYTPVTTLLLAGVALNALLAAVNSWLIARSWEQYEAARQIAFWMMGGVADRGWVHVGLLAPGMVCRLPRCGLVRARPGPAARGRGSGVLARGRRRAGEAGGALERGDPDRQRGSRSAASSVSSVSSCRISCACCWDRGIAACCRPAFLTGAWFVVGADLLARTLAAPREVHLGVVTAFAGAPFFLYLLVRHEKEVAVSR